MTRIIGRHRRIGEDAPADADLLVAVRGGDTAAFEVLYDRHGDAARRLARVLVRDQSDAEDLVAEAFAKVLAALRLGKGPEVAFRAYLLTAIRNACYDRARRDRRIELTEDISRYEGGEGGLVTGTVPSVDPAVARLERSYAARAFAKLPERWQMVLWHTEVEGEKPAAIAPMLGLSPNAVAALAYRARERLRQIYLQEHLSDTGNPSCHWTAGRLGAHVRHGLPRRERSKVDAHLAECADCRALCAELAEVNSGLRGVLAPVVLGVTAAPYLATVPGTAWWTGIAHAVWRGWSIVDGWVRGLVQRHGSTNVAAGAGIAAAALVGVLLFAVALVLEPDPEQPAAPRPPAAAEPVPPAPAPVPAPPPSPRPPPSPEPADPPAPAEPGPPVEQPAEELPPAPGGGQPAAPVSVAPDLSATSLAAGDGGELAIAIRLPDSAPAEPAAPREPAEQRAPARQRDPAEQRDQAGQRDPEAGRRPAPVPAAPAGSPTPVPSSPAVPSAPASPAATMSPSAPASPATTASPRVPASPSATASPRAPVSPAATRGPEEAADAGVNLLVDWPAGITLAGPDAGDGWRCTALDAPEPATEPPSAQPPTAQQVRQTSGERTGEPAAAAASGAVCRRPRWQAGESTTARLPVDVHESLGGFAPVGVTITAGGRRAAGTFRVPVAPVGFQVGYAATGEHRVAMAGNTWMSCPTRPECLHRGRVDNNFVPLLPYLPGPGDPTLPPDLPQPSIAASGAQLAVPEGAEVSWAALHWATTTRDGPATVQLRDPAGRWHPVTPDAVRLSAERALWQAYADVTELVRGGGTWWVSAGEGPLPAGGVRSAGWSLTVVYGGACGSGAAGCARQCGSNPDRCSATCGSNQDQCDAVCTPNQDQCDDQPPSTRAQTVSTPDIAVFVGPVSMLQPRELSVSAATTEGDVTVGLVIWEGDRTITGEVLRLDGQPLGDPANLAASRAAGAVECRGGAVDECGWHTFGVDVAQHHGQARNGGIVTLHTPADDLEVGVLVLAAGMSR